MRAVALTIALLAALPLGGCLRLSYDRCQEDPPHAECDGSVPLDAGSSDGGELEAGTSDDAGSSDAGPSDGGSHEDGGPDSGMEDAGPVMPDAGPLDAS